MIRLIVLARYPVPGEAKTRLIPALGPAGAARLQHAMTRHTLNVARTQRGQDASVQVEVRYTGATLRRMAGLYGRDLTFVDQGQGDLGQRMRRAVHDALDDGCWPVLVGSDCPGLDVATVSAACRALEHNDLVLGPAADGGYYLIALRRAEPSLFAGTPWSTGEVLGRTLAAARGAGLTYALLQELSDVDEPQDLAFARSMLPEHAPYRPARIAITGATGSLGTQFLRTLLPRTPRLHVAALVRPGSAWPEEFRRLVAQYGDQIELIDGDVARLHELDTAGRKTLCNAPDGVWHFAAGTQLQCRDEAMCRQVWQTNVEGTRALVEHCTGKVPLFHVSTAYVCGRREGIICEGDLDGGDGFRNVYEESKHAAERLVRTAMDTGLPGAVFRPSVVVSGDGRGLKVADQLAYALAAAIRRCAAGIIFPAAEGWGINAVEGQWVIDRMLELASDPAGRTYHLTAPMPMTLGQLRDAAHRLYPWFRVGFAAGMAEVQGVSRAADRALRGCREYLTAGPEVVFDRIHTQLYASGAEEPALDVASCLQSRVGATPRAGMPVPS